MHAFIPIALYKVSAVDHYLFLLPAQGMCKGSLRAGCVLLLRVPGQFVCTGTKACALTQHWDYQQYACRICNPKRMCSILVDRTTYIGAILLVMQQSLLCPSDCATPAKLCSCYCCCHITAETATMTLLVHLSARQTCQLAFKTVVS